MLSAEAQFVAPAENGGFPLLKTILEWYSAEVGWNPDPDFAFANAFCLWRTSIISQGIAARSARGQASSTEAKIYGQKMFPLAELSWQYVQEYESGRKGEKSKL
jgi:hypothetical protein